eukprot:CAMPEP_0202833490 /NCGR_PEP_ID=MMETSP1389-20130828/25953_1 /ASSEMBLY_ACC=CAM_ASM_000865 /TAXON_ID=302021 /ORGANISM="Rhodomonas sp., Strain CCMP768" /LENGTH=186 /DNA_ID=CAMNT_0049508173 /DNA_START=13 /DNA_END=571 /DNA_ORIENTATION=-
MGGHPRTAFLHDPPRRGAHDPLYQSGSQDILLLLMDAGVISTFLLDFGPVNLAAVIRFCYFMREKMVDPRLASRPLVYYCDADTAFATNTAFLLGAYLVLVEKWTPEQAAEPFDAIQPSPFRMFRDATYVPSTYDLCLVDCFRGLQRAVEAGWLDYERFDVEQYEMLDDPETADVHVVCPKFVAFR